MSKILIEEDTVKQALEALALRFSEGWHEGIKIDASDIMLLNQAAQALAEQPAQQQEPESGCNPQDLCAGCRCKYAAQPAQPLPFGVGGGLVAIKTLLSRDPCGHANTAIQMIDAILAEQPAQQPVQDEPEIEYCTNHPCVGDCGQPHNQKEMREFLAAAPQAAQRKPLPRILDICDTGQNSLQLVFKNRFDADAYKAAIKENT